MRLGAYFLVPTPLPYQRSDQVFLFASLLLPIFLLLVRDLLLDLGLYKRFYAELFGSVEQLVQQILEHLLHFGERQHVVHDLLQVARDAPQRVAYVDLADYKAQVSLLLGL